MKQPKLPNLISVLVLTLITVVMWISLNIYRAISTQPAPVVPKEISDPLTPTLDTETIQKLETKIFLSESEIPDVKFSSVLLQTPIPISSPALSPSPTPTTAALQSTESAAIATPTPSQ